MNQSPLRLALLGYGKMGKAIEKAALQAGHNMVARIGSGNRHELGNLAPENTDVVIEFTGPSSAYGNVSQCFNQGLSVVCGSTGWDQHLPEARQLAQRAGLGFIHASNFSIGVNVFMAVQALAAKLLHQAGGYQPHLHEIHHTHKKDAPSGTAITLAHQLLAEWPSLKSWASEQGSADQLIITHERKDPAPGTHTITFQSEVDSLILTHEAHNRDGFALGAVRAAEFLAANKRVATMSEVLGLIVN